MGIALRIGAFSLMALALGGCESEKTAIEPPVITESFTLLRCPAKPRSMLDLEGCAQRRILESDQAINELASTVFRSQLSGVSRERFVRGERAWLTYRRAVCQSRADVYEGGSAAGLDFVVCVVDRNRAHLKDLRAFARNLQPK